MQGGIAQIRIKHDHLRSNCQQLLEALNQKPAPVLAGGAGEQMAVPLLHFIENQRGAPVVFWLQGQQRVKAKRVAGWGACNHFPARKLSAFPGAVGVVAPNQAQAACHGSAKAAAVRNGQHLRAISKPAH